MCNVFPAHYRDVYPSAMRPQMFFNELRQRTYTEHVFLTWESGDTNASTNELFRLTGGDLYDAPRTIGQP
jgi:hypothetical protein